MHRTTSQPHERPVHNPVICYTFVRRNIAPDLNSPPERFARALTDPQRLILREQSMTKISSGIAPEILAYAQTKTLKGRSAPPAPRPFQPLLRSSDTAERNTQPSVRPPLYLKRYFAVVQLLPSLVDVPPQ